MVTALHERESALQVAEVDTAIERCRAEIAAIEAEILAGNPDLQCLCLALSDWSTELRLLRASRGLATVAPRLPHVRSRGDSVAYGPRLP